MGTRRERRGRVARGAAGPRTSTGKALRAGFSLVEVLIAAVILAVAITGIAGSMLSSMALNRVNRDTAVAQQAARRALEELRGVPFEEVFAVFNANPGDNPGGLVAERGPGFAVAGLDLVVGDPDGLAGRIEFPVVPVGGLQELREDVVDVGLSMPRDLDGDGAIDLLDHADDYTLLPVRAIVEWRGVTGVRRIELETMLSVR